MPNNWKFYLILILVFANFSVFGVILRGLAVEEPSVYFLPVGQGDAALLTIQKNNILIDAGPSSKIVNQLDGIIPLYNRKIDLLFISHPNIDHFGGVFELAKRYKIRAVFLNGVRTEQGSYKNLINLIKEQQIPIIYARRGQEISFLTGQEKEAKFVILWPGLELKSGALIKDKQLNDTSIVGLFSYQGLQGLFTGDISTKAEKALLASLPDVDFLKVPHHGSKYSSSEVFLEKIRPEIAAIGVGKNSYGHPTPEALSRLKAIGAEVFRTDVDGLVRIFWQNNQINLTTD
ncbi:MAG: MBL fold metallo-hydrolase [Patescibacteria group bacterium]